MRARIIIRYVGISLVLVAMMMAISGIVAILNDHDDSTMPLLYSAFITFITGMYPMVFVRAEPNVNVKEGIAIVVLAWLACCIFGMFPYICYAKDFSIIDAFFESVSGFTTTGASILSDIEALPAGLLFWRAATAWVGGLGIVSIFSLVIPRSLDWMSVLSGAELSDITKSQSSRHGKAFIRAMLTVYLSLTFGCAGLLRLAGLPWFDAVTNAMSTCSTCGFCIKNESISAYGSIYVELILIAFMLTSGISFMRIFGFALGRRETRRRFSSITGIYLAFVGIATAIITLDLHALRGHSLLHSLRLALFQVSSITTTTGFATADTSTWPALSIIILIAASIVCACSGSTSGGLKMDRAILMVSYVGQCFRQGINPRRLTRTSLDGKMVPEELAVKTIWFVMLYMALLVLGALINTAGGLDLETALSASVACLGNVGPGFGEVGSMANYAGFPAWLKLTSTLQMIAGRLEIIPLISFLGIIWN